MSPEPLHLVVNPPSLSGVELHRRAIWRYLRMLGASPDEADDLTQETMVVGLEKGDPDNEPAMRPFLRGVARNQWLRSRQWWQRRREREIAVAVDELWMDTAEADGGEALLEQLRECLDVLAPRTRKALELHYRDGQAWTDVAREIGLQPNGIKTLAHRARQSLRTCLDGEKR